jgi:anthranilate phosphoribosyltransferase
VLNAAAAIYVSGRVVSFADGVAAAEKSLDSGEAKKVLERMRLANPKPASTKA